MVFKAVLELALHISSFQNIDLLHQGVYRVSFKIFHWEKSRKIYDK